METGNTFRLRNDQLVMYLEKIDDNRAKVTDPGTTTFMVGDIVAPARTVPWETASYRVNSRRTRLSPMALVLLGPVEGWVKLLGVAGESRAPKAKIHDFQAYKRLFHPEPAPVA